MIKSLIFKTFILLMALTNGGCAVWDGGASNTKESNNLIATPPSYYSTAKARYLGVRYKDNLDRLVERITRNPKTTSLQFANNISSVGGIGFFTHSATKSPDERYLEVVVAAPETFEGSGEFNEKVQQLFTRYGGALLEIVSGDNDIYQDRELSGYGLNFAWRDVVSGPNGNRVVLERAILYFPKERVLNFLGENINQNELLANAVIYSVEEDGPLNLVSYRPKTPKPDIRPAIQEDNLASTANQPGSQRRTKDSAKPADPVKPSEGEQATGTEGPDGAATAKVSTPLPNATDASMSDEAPAPSVDQPSDQSPTTDESPTERVALAENGPSATVGEQLVRVDAAAKRLEGFIVQVAFSDKEKAQRWAESMEKRGYVVSVTQAGTGGPLRVRLGNFAGRDEAERQVQSFKQEGLKGIVINLPQAFQPQARTSIP